MDIIVKKPQPVRGRSKDEERFIKAGWGRTMTDEQNDKCTFRERDVKERYGADKSVFKQYHIAKVK